MTITGVPRVVKKLRLTEQAWASLDAFCARYNTSFNATIEALGQHMAEHPEWMPDQVGRRAQAIDRERYSRRG